MSEISKLEQNLIIKKIDNETVNVSVMNNEVLMAIVGQFDQNLKSLSSLTNTNVYFRGNSITCKGDKEHLSRFCEAIKFLINKYLITNIIEKEDIVLSVKKNIEIEETNIKSFKQLIKTPKKSVIARSEKQSEYIKALKENEIVFSIGPAGTGKSFLAVSVAITLLMEKKIETGEIEIAPLAFMRGRTLKNCFAILDEAQNATETQIKMFLTRIGENSKLVVNGDPSQVDLINKTHSGLIKSKNILKDVEEIKLIEFDHNDVVRHPLVSKIIRAYQNKSTNDKD